MLGAATDVVFCVLMFKGNSYILWKNKLCATINNQKIHGCMLFVLKCQDQVCCFTSRLCPWLYYPSTSNPAISWPDSVWLDALCCPWLLLTCCCLWYSLSHDPTLLPTQICHAHKLAKMSNWESKEEQIQKGKGGDTVATTHCLNVMFFILLPLELWINWWLILNRELFLHH